MRTRQIGRRLPAELASVLERDIREQKFAAGEKLPTESALAEQFAVSRPAVREAIAQLRSAGLVHTRQGAGTFVADATSPRSAFSLAGKQLDKAELCYVFEIREEVETGAAALAARHRSPGDIDAMRTALNRLNDAVEHGQPAAQHDIDFHHAIAAASGNRFFHELLEIFAEQIVESIVIARSNTAREGRLTHSVQLEHQSIFDAIEEGNPEAARAAMHVHLSNAKKRLGLRRPAASSPTEAAE